MIIVTDAYTTPIIAASAPYTIPLHCEPQADTVQFVWRAMDGETVDETAVDQRLTTIAEQVNYMFWLDSDSLTEARLPAWKIDGDCNLDIQFVDDSYHASAIEETKLIIIEETDQYCGEATVFNDSRPGRENLNNGSSIAWVSRDCLSAYVVAHEFLHSIGAVQHDAPHADGDNHATDFGDVMATSAHAICPRADTIDCGHDDYFSLNPTDYLATHWNTADSIFLVSVPKYSLILQPVFRN